MPTRSEPLTAERCTKRLLERGLTLKTCPSAYGVEASVYSGPGEQGRKLGSVQGYIRDGKLKVGWSLLDPSIRKGGVGTLLYEAVVAHACAIGMPVRSDHLRSRFAEAFWRKQHAKRRVRCVKVEGEQGQEYYGPMRDLEESFRSGEITSEQYNAIVSRLPESKNGGWPCSYYEIKNPCRTRTLAGLEGLGGGLDKAKLVRRFHAAANMTPSEIRAWAKNPVARCASLPRRSKTSKSAISELTQVARMKTSSPSTWSESDWTKARDLVAFVARHAAKAAPGDRCSTVRVVALRNWAHRRRGCAVPTSCARKAR